MRVRMKKEDYRFIRCILTKLEKAGITTINEAIIVIDEMKEGAE